MITGSTFLFDLPQCIKRAIAGLLLFATALGISALPTAANAQATEVEISSGTLNSNTNNGTKWLSSDFHALATGDHELTVTWDNVGADLRINVFDDATGDTLGDRSYSPGQVVWTGALDETRDYRVSIWVRSGGATDFVAILSADEPLPIAITTQPSDQTVNEGDDVIFTVAAIGGGGMLSYQWFADGVAITGATNDTLTLAAVTVDDSGAEYTVSVSDENGGVVSSNVATLSVLPVTIILIGHGILDSEEEAGPRWTRIDFDSLATATHTVTVSWNTEADIRFKVREANGNAISSTIRNTNPGVWQGELEEGKSYYIGMWSTAGNANYIATVEASVEPPTLSITTQPTDQTVNVGSGAVFTVEATGGSGSLNYLWYANGSPIGGATTDTLTLVAVTVDDSGTNYSVAVSDDNNTLISDTAILNVVSPPPTGELVAQWKMNEGSNASVISDSSGNGHDGTIGQDVLTGVAGNGGTVYRWPFSSPTAAYQPERIVNAPHDSALNPGSGNYSITITYRTNVSFGNIIQKGQGGAAGGYWKIENPGGHLTCVFRGVAGNGGWNRKEVVSSSPLNDGEYHTVTCERVGDQLRLIVDGVLDDTANNSTGSISNNQPISIGGKTNCNNTTTSCDYFSGWIDEISIGQPE